MRLTRLSLISIFLIAGHSVSAADWPQWRHDANRSAATDEELPDTMTQQWMLDLGKPAPAYEHQYRMCADFTYAPVAAGGLLYVPSNVTDQVMALDMETGKLAWRFITGGPVRFAPVCGDGKVYFTSDDGYLYCVSATEGTLLWRLRGVPDDLPDALMLINGRMVSRWPARGAPILHNGIVYFGAGIWPEEGVYQNAVEAETGELIWRSDALSIIKEGMCDHGTNHDLSLPPHGYPAIIHNKLAVTSGRTLATWFDLQTGRMDPYTSFYVKFLAPRGTWYVAGNDDYWMQGGNCFAAHPDVVPPKPEELKNTVIPLAWSRKSPAAAEYSLKHRPFLFSDKPNGVVTGAGYENLYSEPIFTDDTMYASEFSNKEKYALVRGHTFVKYRPFDRIVARDLKNPVWRKLGKDAIGASKRTAPIAAIEFPIKWELETPLRALIKAGNHLVAGGQDRIAAVAIPEGGQSPRVAWESKIEGNPVNTLLADRKLITVTDTGKIYCFGNGNPSNPEIPTADTVEMSPEYGFALVIGWGNGKEALRLAKDPAWRVVILENDVSTIRSARNLFNRLGVNGRRAQIIPITQNTHLTPYWANHVIINDPLLFGDPRKTTSVAVDALRPFTGKMILNSNVDRRIVEDLIRARVDYRLDSSVLSRISAPAGAGDWSHESAAADNSFISQDRLVKWPLGVLWYSGDIDRFYTPEAHYQHERNPYPLVKDGRMFIITHDVVHAVDIYTGNYLWKARMPLTPYVRTRLIDNRLYGRPTDRNYVVADDVLYCVTGAEIYLFDVQTGEQIISFPVPDPLRIEAQQTIGPLTSQTVKDTGETLTLQPVPEWTEVRLWKDMLVAKIGKHLVGVDRHSGDIRWSRQGTLEYTTYAIGNDTLFGIDCVPDSYSKPQKQREKRGILFALDPNDGSERWATDITYQSWPQIETPGSRPWMKPPMPFLGYNVKHDLVVIAYNGNNIIVANGKDGAVLWTLKNPDMERDPRIYTPNIMDDYLVLSLSKYTGGMGYFVDIRTGERLHAKSEIPRARTCGRLLGNNHILTYRDAATELYDVDANRTIPFNSMRAGCTTSFIPAGGVLTGPMLGHGCVCNYPMFASVALVHMSEIDAIRPEAVRQSWGADL